jgi:hypothetical protein
VSAADRAVVSVEARLAEDRAVASEAAWAAVLEEAAAVWEAVSAADRAAASEEEEEASSSPAAAGVGPEVERLPRTEG